jgi:hypothetical protein
LKIEVSQLGKCLRTRLEANSEKIGKKRSAGGLGSIQNAMTNIVDLLVRLIGTPAMQSHTSQLRYDAKLDCTALGRIPDQNASKRSFSPRHAQRAAYTFKVKALLTLDSRLVADKPRNISYGLSRIGN